MKSLFLVVLVFFSIQAHTQNSPTKINMVPSVLKEYEATPKQKEEMYINLENAIRNVSYGQIILPEMLNVYMLQKYQNALYLPHGSLLIVPYQLTINNNSKHPKFTRGVELHELGHSIFEANLPIIIRNNKQDSAVFNTYLKRKSIYQQYRITTAVSVTLTNLLPVGPTRSKMIKDTFALQAKYEKAMSSEMMLLKKTNEIIKPFAAFDEFFADVFAVVLTRDPDVIKDALYFTSHNPSRETDRSFSLRIGKRELIQSTHNRYSLSRLYLYKYYLSNPLFRNKGNSWLLKRTIESIRCNYYSIPEMEKVINAEIDRIEPRFQQRFIFEKINEHLNNCIDLEFNK